MILYPIWFAQDVEGIRTDVRSVKHEFIRKVETYIDQVKKHIYDAPPIPYSLTHDFYKGEKEMAYKLLERKIIKIENIPQFVSLVQINKNNTCPRYIKIPLPNDSENKGLNKFINLQIKGKSLYA